MEWLELHWTLVVALQFALERGVPTIISVLVTIKLLYPSRSFNMTHCSRCLIPWGGDNAKYMMKLIEYRDLVATGFFLVLPLTGRLIINHGRDVERILKRRRISRKPLYFFVGRRNMKKVKPQSGGNESIKTIVKNGNLMLTCVNPLIQMMSGIRRWKLV